MCMFELQAKHTVATSAMGAEGRTDMVVGGCLRVVSSRTIRGAPSCQETAPLPLVIMGALVGGDVCVCGRGTIPARIALAIAKLTAQQ